jgi:hypothetical protein
VANGRVYAFREEENQKCEFCSRDGAQEAPVVVTLGCREK